MILRLYKPCNAKALSDAIRATDTFNHCELMHRLLTLLALCVVTFTCAQAQRTKPLVSAGDNDGVAATRAVAALRQLDKDVIVYRSLGEFEAGRKLASVSLATFRAHLHEATDEVESVLPRLTDARLKTSISNALASYRDGAYWWEKIYQPRVIHVSEFRSNDNDRTPSASFFHANLPYTVAIHWRQANKHLQRAVRYATN
jgi:hypothetical protein